MRRFDKITFELPMRMIMGLRHSSLGVIPKAALILREDHNGT